MTFPELHQTMKTEQNQINGTFFALIEGVDPGLSPFLTKQYHKDFPGFETENRPNSLLHIYCYYAERYLQHSSLEDA